MNSVGGCGSACIHLQNCLYLGQQLATLQQLHLSMTSSGMSKRSLSPGLTWLEQTPCRCSEPMPIASGWVSKPKAPRRLRLKRAVSAADECGALAMYSMAGLGALRRNATVLCASPTLLQVQCIPIAYFTAGCMAAKLACWKRVRRELASVCVCASVAVLQVCALACRPGCCSMRCMLCPTVAGGMFRKGDCHCDWSTLQTPLNARPYTHATAPLARAAHPNNAALIYTTLFLTGGTASSSLRVAGFFLLEPPEEKDSAQTADEMTSPPCS